MLEANEMEVLRKIDRINKNRQNKKSTNPAVSRLLMSGWKEEEDNETDM